jgi:signal recognition particle subunit SRP54
MPLGNLFGGQLPPEALEQATDDRELVKIEAMIHSMTKAERAKPDLFLVDGDDSKLPAHARLSRKKASNKPRDPMKYAEMPATDFVPGRVARVARGSGRTEDDVRGLVGRFLAMRDVFGMLGDMMGGGGLLGNLPGIKQIRQMGAMKRMAQDPQMMQALMGQGGGMPGMPAMPGGMPGMPRLPSPAVPQSKADKAKAKAQRKKEKDARKKNRRR